MSDEEQQPEEEQCQEEDEPQPEEEEPCPEEEEQQPEEEEQQPDEDEQQPMDDWLEQRPIDMDGGPNEEYQKRNWPDLIGRPADEVKDIISSERPDLNVEILHEYNATKDFRMGRVRIFVDDAGIVAQAPYVG